MITLDVETKSKSDLTKVGQWAYSEHPSTDVICVCWAVDDGEVESWVPGWHTGALETLFRRLEAGEEIEAHNYAFELSIWINVMCRRYDWPDPRNFTWRDTMAAACYYALPAKLDKLSQVLGFGRKDPEGGRLITKYSKLYLKTSKLTIPRTFKRFLFRKAGGPSGNWSEPKVLRRLIPILQGSVRYP